MAILSDSQMKVLRAIRDGKSLEWGQISQRWLLDGKRCPTATIDFLLRNKFVSRFGNQCKITDLGLQKFKTA